MQKGQRPAMRQDERLFLIVELLRNSRVPIPAEALAGELEVTTRSVHRDIADLVKQGTAIRGGATTGYSLDRQQKRAATRPAPVDVDDDVVVESSEARRLIRAALAKAPVKSPATTPVSKSAHNGFDLERVEEWIRRGYKLFLHYSDVDGNCSKRTVWPVEVSPSGRVRIVAAWCELRQAFRQFRTDRILRADFLEERYSEDPKKLRRKWDAQRY